MSIFFFFLLIVLSSISTALIRETSYHRTALGKIKSTGGNIIISELERKEIWKTVSTLEKQAIQKLSSATTDLERDEALKLLAQSVSLKTNDPFIQLAQKYSHALEDGDQKEVDRIFTSLKLVGFPPHLQAMASKLGRTQLVNNEPDTNLTEIEVIDAGSVFSDTVTEKIRVKVHSFYDNVKSEPSNGKFMFWYKVAIFNEGTEPVQVVARMWEIEKCRGEKEVVRGAGIIGTQPIIPPGEVFTYKSACPLKVFPPRGKRMIGSMSGAYTLCKGNMGQHNFTVKVSKFNFILPEDVAATLG